MKTKRKLTIAGIVIGALLTLSPLFGILGTVFGMTHAFHSLGNSGITDPKTLADSIGTTLFATAAGVALFPIGILILSLSLVLYFRPQPSASPSSPIAKQKNSKRFSI